jgi:hypothetical protein
VVNGGALWARCCLTLLHLPFSARGHWLALLHWHLVFRTRRFLLVIQILLRNGSSDFSKMLFANKQKPVFRPCTGFYEDPIRNVITMRIWIYLHSAPNRGSAINGTLLCGSTSGKTKLDAK